VRLLLSPILVLALATSAAAQGGPAIRGIVTDQTGGRLPGAAVEVQTSAGTRAAMTLTDSIGEYAFANLPAGSYDLVVSFPNFGTVRRIAIQVTADTTRTVDVVLALSLTADVAVTGRRTFRNLAELDPPGHGLIGAAGAASDGIVTARQIETRPLMRTGEVLETVPGLVISQHSGEGKANQYYLRGFNLDHGTDFSTTVMGMPVNMPTHAHGQGYADVNFLIPELISVVQYRKGPYSAEAGDFSTAGSADINYTSVLERPLLRASGGADGWGRIFAGASPRVGRGRLLVALDANHNDGPWVRPDDYRKTNAVVRYSRGDVRNGLSLTAMSYRGDWDATDQVPARAVESSRVERFGGVDDTGGGTTARYSLSSNWQRTTPTSVTWADGYAMRYRLNLFSNFTYFLDDPVNGDQFEQADRRRVTGGRVAHRRGFDFGGRQGSMTVGALSRSDNIGTVGLYHTAARERLETVREDAVRQWSMGVFAENTMQWNSWARTTVGLRADRYRYTIDASNPLNGGKTSAGRVGPKAALILGPWQSTEFYVNVGNGFHSNDARGTTITVDPRTGDPAERVTPLVSATGTEFGVRSVFGRGVHTTLAVWQLDLESELLFVGDAGTTEAGRPSRRQGVEWSLFAAPNERLTFDADVSIARSRFRDDVPAGRHIPGALERVASFGLTAENVSHIFGSLRLRYFGGRPLIEDNSVRSRETGLVNAQLGVQVARNLRVMLDAFNLFNSKVSDIDYFYTSRLSGEPADGVNDIHTHPAMPRTVRLSVDVKF
jgi:outer membrane receptor protein involved in Fe transport